MTLFLATVLSVEHSYKSLIMQKLWAHLKRLHSALQGP